MEETIIKIFEKQEIAITLSGLAFGFSIMLFLGFVLYIMIKEGKDE